MKLHEIHVPEAPLVLILLRQLMDKGVDVYLRVRGPNGQSIKEGWINHVEYQEDSEDYDIVYSVNDASPMLRYFVPASHLETFELKKQGADEWELEGQWEMPRPVKEDLDDLSEEPLTSVLLKQQLTKGTKVFAQRTKTTAVRSSHQAIYPVVSAKWRPDDRTLEVNLKERYGYGDPDDTKAGHGYRPMRMSILNQERQRIDDRWTLTKVPFGMVLHVATTPVSTIRDDDEAE